MNTHIYMYIYIYIHIYMYIYVYTTEYIIRLIVERTESQFSMGVADVALNVVCTPTKSIASQGDLSVFYFSIAVLTCLDEMVSQERTVSTKSTVLNNFLDHQGLNLFLKMTFGLMGSKSYMVTSLACRNKSELGISFIIC
jgi:hypothetical protein